jgi:Bacteriophage CI repressor helix-turn-helix domain
MSIKEESSIGFRIVQAFGAKDLKEVAQTIDEKYPSLHNWSTGRRDFPTNVLLKIARMANTSVDWILTGENKTASIETIDSSFDKIFEEKIRAIVREEISTGSAIHEKIQGIILAMQSNVKEQDAFQAKEEKAA